MNCSTGSGQNASRDGMNCLPSGMAGISAVASRAGVGRVAGFLSRQEATSERSRGGRPLRLGSSNTIRYSSAAGMPPPNGGWPVAAKYTTPPSEKMSLGGSTLLPRACSGDMYEGVPSTPSVVVSLVPSSTRAMPKSISRGPSAATSTLPGFRSRWTRPLAWMARSASASPAASFHTACSGSGPFLPTTSWSEGARHEGGGQPGRGVVRPGGDHRGRVHPR